MTNLTKTLNSTQNRIKRCAKMFYSSILNADYSEFVEGFESPQSASEYIQLSAYEETRREVNAKDYNKIKKFLSGTIHNMALTIFGVNSLHLICHLV